MQMKGAIFDMDGLLFDTEKVYQETWHEIAKEHNIKLGNGFLEAISGTNGEQMCRILECYYQVPDGADIMQECMARVQQKLSVHVPIKEGVKEILNFFREKGIRLAVASSSSVQQIESNLKISGIEEYFTEIISGSEVDCGKPAPDIFLLAAKRIDCRPEECFVFEDSKNGIRAGHEAGCVTIMVPDLIKPTSEIVPYCFKIYSSMREAREEIGTML